MHLPNSLHLIHRKAILSPQHNSKKDNARPSVVPILPPIINTHNTPSNTQSPFAMATSCLLLVHRIQTKEVSLGYPYSSFPQGAAANSNLNIFCLKVSASCRITTSVTAGGGVGAWSNSKAGDRKWSRNPILLKMPYSSRRCVSRFSSSASNTTENGNHKNNLTKSDSNILDACKDSGNLSDDTDRVTDSDKDLNDVSSSDVQIEIEKTGKNRRRIQSSACVDASLQTVWNILTDYEKLADFIPGLAVSQLLQKTNNFARLFQIGQQNLAFGLKFKAKGVIDCYEKDIQNLPLGQRRDIEFRMVEGDFQLFQGKWSVEQISRGENELADSVIGQQFHTTLSYVVDVEPKVWLPVRLVQGRLCGEIKMNLLCIKLAAERAFQNEVSDHE